MGLVYFLWTNFKVLRNERLAKRTLVFGAFLILALLLILPLLPEEFPSAPIALAYMFVGRYVADKHQMTKMGIAASTGFAFHSNWRVFGLGLLCMLASVIIVAVPLVYLAFLRG
ncbi:hypothetical protein SAMN05216569_1827 [Pseudoxanthomonas sp. CF125]|nr:hypothetical protein SAMN05216569_1827 [Pseudoxanthomonas sp. CF125]